MKFTKMHGCGNDFVIVDGPADLTVARVRELCDRRRGSEPTASLLSAPRRDDAGP